MTTFDETLPPHARDAPAWSDCGDPASPDHGAVYAWPAARGALALTFDRRGLRHALTLFRGAAPGREIVLHGRRFDVVTDALRDAEAG
jgi:hypothetical protein